MIERLTATGGERIIKVDGRLMASRIDPVAEARAWANGRPEFVGRVKTVFVLGLGCGYHVAELLKRTEARVVVIEPRADVVDAVPPVFDRNVVHVECLSSVADVRASDVVRRGVAESYVTLIHPASRALDPELYREIAAQLNGRDWGSLNWIWTLKGHADPGPSAAAEPDSDPLTIYDFERSELVQNSDERERLLIKALRELVK